MKRSLILCAALLVAVSCREPAAPPSADLISAPWWKPLPPLLRCTPLPADSVTQTIGPEGGTILVGPHTLVIPAGALDTTVDITAIAPSDTVRRVRFYPEGLTFAQAPTLTMSYTECGILGVFTPKRIAYTTPSLDILEYLVSVDDWSSRTVTGDLHHFSDYVIAW